MARRDKLIRTASFRALELHNGAVREGRYFSAS